MPRRPTAIRRQPVDTPSAELEAELPETSTEHGRVLPWLLLLLAGSGCAALIYEIVWFQLLQLVIGSTAVSLGLLLASYMGGLCLGSAVFSRLIAPRQNPLRIYAYLESGIGIFGIVALFGVPIVGRLYTAGATSGLAGMVLRGAVAAVAVLPPTLLMGGSYPAIARWVQEMPQTAQRASWLGLLYSANIAGAVIGCGLAGFYLLRVHDIGVATWTAAAINAAVALLALLLAARIGKQSRPTEASAEPLPQTQRAPGATLVYLVIAFSGMTALGAEVVWTRLLSLLLGPTVYTFSIILGVFLFGLCAGGCYGSYLAKRVSNPRLALTLCQVLLAAGIAWTAWTLAYVLPYWPVDPWLSVSPWFNFDLDITRCVRAILPATLLWGASFPLALAAAAGKGEDPGRLSGEIYAANTAGSIVGALAFSLILIPALGTQGSERALVWLAAIGAAVAVGSVFIDRSAVQPARGGLAWMAAAMAGLGILALALGSFIAPIPWQAIAYGRRVAPILRNQATAGDAATGPLFMGEGINSSVVITQRGDLRSFYVGGKAEASSGVIDMRLQRMMGHLPALVRTAPHSVLVVGFGAGVTAGSFVPYPEVSSITICELEPMIPKASDEFFGKENNHVLHDPRTHMVNDDARHYILTTPDKFDVITTDPIHPWVKGTSSLYSKEYYELVRSHLNAGGVAAQWLPIYESDEETVKTEMATFFSVFPNATIWSNYLNGDGYDLVMLGSDGTVHVNVDQLQARLSQPGYSGVSASLAQTEFRSAVELLSTYAGRASDLAPTLTNAQINDDLNMRLQYIAGMGLNTAIAPRLYREILSFRKFPDDLLTGTGAGIETLRDLIGRQPRTF